MGGRIRGLEGARGVAALMVFVYHVWLFGLDPPGPGFRSRVADGLVGHLWIGLTFFFVLSGFVLYRPFAAAALQGTPGPKLRRWAAARAARIVPAYWFALLFAAPMLAIRMTPVQTLENFAFLQTTVRHGVVAIGPSWTLCIEATFYVALPAIAIIASRYARGSARRLAVPLTALIAIGVVDRSGLTLHGWEKLPETIDLFAVGMLVAVAVEAGWTRRWMPIAAAPFAVAAVFVARPGSGMAPGDPPTAALFDVLVAAAFGLVVIGIVHDVRPLRFFSWRPVVALGTISYGFYLWHQTVLLYLVWDQRATNALPVAARTALVFAVSICLATLSWFAVERPFIALAKRKRRPGAEGPALQLANAPQP